MIDRQKYVLLILLFLIKYFTISDASNYIMNGTFARPGEFPSVANIGKFCGGTGIFLSFFITNYLKKKKIRF